jgi:hypothetical protein
MDFHGENGLAHRVPMAFHRKIRPQHSASRHFHRENGATHRVWVHFHGENGLGYGVATEFHDENGVIHRVPTDFHRKNRLSYGVLTRFHGENPLLPPTKALGKKMLHAIQRPGWMHLQPRMHSVPKPNPAHSWLAQRTGRRSRRPSAHIPPLICLPGFEPFVFNPAHV